MEVNKNLDRQICGNIFINIKTIKNENKLFTFHCAFCGTDYGQLQTFAKHLEEHLNYFEAELEDGKYPVVLLQQEEIKEQFDIAYNKGVNATGTEVYEDPLETEKSEKPLIKSICSLDEFVPVDVKNECEDSYNEECYDSNQVQQDDDTHCANEAEITIEETPEYSNKLYSYIFRDLSSDEDSNDDVLDEDYNKHTNADFYDDPLEAENSERCFAIDVKNENEEIANNDEESCDSSSVAQENCTNDNQEDEENIVIEDYAENSDLLYAYIFKDLTSDELADDPNDVHFNSKNDENYSSNTNNLQKGRRTIFVRILPSLMQLYQKYEMLWQVDNVAFGIKEKANEVYNKILEELKADNDINITLEDISYHINYINVLYSKDKRNELTCKMEGKEFQPEYKHYAELSFLHDSQGPFLCTTCNKLLVRYDSYAQHMAEHDGTQPFKCPCCEGSFNNYHRYLVHKKRHLGIFKFHCEICGKGYSLKTDLEWHVTSHTGDKPYLCQICGRGFRARHGYVNHIRRHEQRFRYECHICKRGFNLLHALNAHVKSHLNIRDIICEICGKGFVHKQYLRKHELIHGDVKKYKCNECGKAFFQACSLRSHRKTHHS